MIAPKKKEKRKRKEIEREREEILSLFAEMERCFGLVPDKGQGRHIPAVALRKIFSHFVKIGVDKLRPVVYNSHVRWFTMGGAEA